MKTITVRREILCRCNACHQGTTWLQTKHGPKAAMCATCAGTGEVVRFVNEIRHVDMRSLANDYSDATKETRHEEM